MTCLWLADFCDTFITRCPARVWAQKWKLFWLHVFLSFKSKFIFVCMYLFLSFKFLSFEVQNNFFSTQKVKSFTLKTVSNAFVIMAQISLHIPLNDSRFCSVSVSPVLSHSNQRTEKNKFRVAFPNLAVAIVTPSYHLAPPLLTWRKAAFHDGFVPTFSTKVLRNEVNQSPLTWEMSITASQLRGRAEVRSLKPRRVEMIPFWSILRIMVPSTKKITPYLSTVMPADEKSPNESRRKPPFVLLSICA